MLQQSFHNWSSEPKTYTNMMYSMHTYGHGYFGISGVGNYLGWSAYKIGEGFTYKDDIICNYNLIFQC